MELASSTPKLAAMMKDTLDRYRARRDFKATPEPPGVVTRSGNRLRFVVQEHRARRLHYDLRLELDGVLKSWAVPKGLSDVPGERRMAVQTEDHPLSYADFEGTIPPRHYGAGTMTIWDSGDWSPVGDAREGLDKGKLKIRLRGKRLRGTWNLVRMRGRAGESSPSWLLMRERADGSSDDAESAEPADLAEPAGFADEAGFAVPAEPADPLDTGPPAAAAPLPDRLEPQLATLVDAPPPGDAWHYELKFDGYRMLARIEGGKVRLLTRNGNDWSSRMPALCDALGALDLESGWLDGEIVVPDDRGVPDFQALQNAFDSARVDRIQYLLFDLLHHDGLDLRKLPLRARRERLRRLMTRNRSRHLRFSETLDGDPAAMLANACELGIEGLIGKRADARHEAGRTRTWIKLKCKRRQEFVIGGWTDPRGSREVFGSLLLGVHDETGALRYAGSVGTGFDAAGLRAVGARLATVPAPRSPFADKVTVAGAHWVAPTLVAEVSFAEWTQTGRVRHAVFHGLRDDKPAKVIVRERPVPSRAAASSSTRDGASSRAAATSRAAASTRAAATSRAAAAPPRANRVATAGFVITHPDRTIDATAGLAKIDLVGYYERIAQYMLPHIAGRPIALLRAPGGLDGKRFFQKHGDRARIPGVRDLDPSLDSGGQPLLQIDTVEGLVGAAQMNTIELHVWNSRSRAIERPDRMVFDLDPGEGLGWAEVIEGAQLTRALLDELGLKSFVKTSGSKGLHVVVPIAARHDWETVRTFSQAVVRHMAKMIPSRFVASPGASRRIGKIFVDYLRNGRGATTAAAFSARARPGLPVSMPIEWDDLKTLERSDRWTIRDAVAHVEARREDPWKDLGTSRQTLTKAIARIEAVSEAPVPRRRR
jgi:bifunctional non-homologous end joining protein LigD